MSPQVTLDRHRDVVVVNADKIALEMSLALKNEPQDVQRQAFAGDQKTGFFYLYRMPKHPGKVFECVISTAGDAITSVYEEHRIFASPGELMKSRDYLQRALAEKVGLSREGVGIDDAGRGRTLGLEELSTGQLIDMLAEKMGQSIMVTDSHSAAGIGGIELPH